MQKVGYPRKVKMQIVVTKRLNPDQILQTEVLKDEKEQVLEDILDFLCVF